MYKSKFFIAINTAVFLLCASNAYADGSASQSVQIIQRDDAPPYNAHSNCAEQGGMRVFVQNKNASQIIEVNIDRYFDNVRQAGRSMLAIKPGDSTPLGCSVAMKTKQNWKIVSAKFVDKKTAMDDYGIIY